ncbi:hypothetical protein [Ralstonia pseudosolanacearum]|uniref:hypothetical protein n=1 Tax=Ralstonia pseudosolanacearum TaxID=1310165 RepID=UPI001FFC0481|nr:hypothetical protein [Ralstonia pseudosolanacearum]
MNEENSSQAVDDGEAARKPGDVAPGIPMRVEREPLYGPKDLDRAVRGIARHPGACEFLSDPDQEELLALPLDQRISRLMASPEILEVIRLLACIKQMRRIERAANALAGKKGGHLTLLTDCSPGALWPDWLDFSKKNPGASWFAWLASAIARAQRAVDELPVGPVSEALHEAILWTRRFWALPRDLFRALSPRGKSDAKNLSDQLLKFRVTAARWARNEGVVFALVNRYHEQGLLKTRDPKTGDSAFAAVAKTYPEFTARNVEAIWGRVVARNEGKSQE